MARLASALLAAALSPAPAAAAPAAPPLQAIEIVRTVEIDFPDKFGLISGGAPELAPDQRHLLVRVTDSDGAEQVAMTTLHGREFRCLTCGVAPSASKAKFFDDEKRLFFGNTSGQTGGETSDFQWSVLECAPDVYRCDERTVLPVDFPLPGLPQAQNREADPEYGGNYIGWNEVRSTEGTRVTIGRLVRKSDHYEINDTRVVNPPFSTSGGIDDFINGGRFYEGGDTVLGGDFFKYQTTTTAGNYDTWLLNMRTGERRQLTTDLDYNEIAEYSPDGRLAYYSSARGLDRMDVFSQLVRPSLLDMVTFPQLGRISLSGNRLCMNEGWLMSMAPGGQELGGYAGQPARLAENWTLRNWRWFDSGNRAVVTETRLPSEEQPADPAKRQRVSIVRLPGVERTEPLAHVTLDEVPWEQWTVPADDYQGMPAKQLASVQVPGRDSGTATVSFNGTFAAGSWSVSFDEYSDDGLTFINGTESLTTPGVVVAALYQADLTQHGAHYGYMTANLEVGPQNRFQGTVESKVDGNYLQGVPQQADCPGLRQAELELRVVKRERLDRGHERVVVKVVSRVPEDRFARPVEAVSVQLGPKARGEVAGGRRIVSTHSDERGKAVLIVPRRPGKRFVVSARSDGFEPAQALLEGEE